MGDDVGSLREQLAALQARADAEDAAKRAAEEEADNKGYMEKFGDLFKETDDGEPDSDVAALLREGMSQAGADWKTATVETVVEKLIKPMVAPAEKMAKILTRALSKIEKQVDQVVGDAPVVDLPPDGSGQPVSELGAVGELPTEPGAPPSPMVDTAVAPPAPPLPPPDPASGMMPLPPAPEGLPSGQDVSSVNMKNIKPKAPIDNGLDADMKLINKALKEMKI